uniref:Uncharacterized protein n=1 Tax=Cucumis melo TaxID=3656 RepID=A0A9I9DIY3_CUCME
MKGAADNVGCRRRNLKGRRKGSQRKKLMSRRKGCGKRKKLVAVLVRLPMGRGLVKKEDWVCVGLPAKKTGVAGGRRSSEL